MSGRTARVDEVNLHERVILPLQVAGRFKIALVGAPGQFRHHARDLIRDDGDNSLPSQRNQRNRDGIVAAEDGEAVGRHAVFTAIPFGDYPVVGITWDAANKYCQWIGGQLPSEAQWEKAARGQNGNKYPWGNNSPNCDLANLKTCGGHTSPVNAYPNGKSSYGLLDMAGNVYEWVNDFYDPNYYASAPSSNPTGPSTGNDRMIRGSSFETDLTQILSAIRHPSPQDYHNYDLGFRCVVPQPMAYAPYCQSASYLPIGGTQTQNATCSLPDVQVGGNYCEGAEQFCHGRSASRSDISGEVKRL